MESLKKEMKVGSRTATCVYTVCADTSSLPYRALCVSSGSGRPPSGTILVASDVSQSIPGSLQETLLTCVKPP